MIGNLAEKVAEARAGYWGADAGQGDVDVRVIRNGDLSADGGVLWTRCPMRGFSSHEAEKCTVRLGDILITTSGECGKVAIVRHLPEGRYCASNFVRVIRPTSDIEPRFLFWWFTSAAAQDRMAPFIRGTTLKNLSFANFIESAPFAAPALAEQRRIADILDKADAIRRKRKQAIALTEDLLRSAFLDMFGDPRTNPKGWSVKPFAELVAETQLGLVRAAAEQGNGRAYPYVRMNAIRSNGHLDLSNLARVDATTSEVASLHLRLGDFLFNTRNSRELVGKAAVFYGDGTYLFNNNIMRVRFRSGIEPDFINAYWQTSSAQRELEARKAGTTSVFAIYYKSLATLPVLVPPASVQARYAQLCAAARRALQSHERHIFEAEHLFESLVSRAFAGRISGAEVAC